jgi:hypothetical protein
MATFRYSRSRFRHALTVALALTVTVSALAHMLLIAFGNDQLMFWTAATALIFFAFLSAGMLTRYVRDAVVVAVYPTGLYDARHANEIIAWEAIREIVLRRREDEYEIDVYLWRHQRRKPGDAAPDFTMELAWLDVGAAELAREIERYKPVQTDFDAPAQMWQQ